jgi:hypothetical protein
MPAFEVVFLQTDIEYQARRDDIFKWAGLQIEQAYDRMDDSKLRTPEVRSRPLLGLFCSLDVTARGAILAVSRLDRQLDAFRCIVAIRLRAASHRRLAERLDQIADAPVPLDPMTGRPFRYKLEGGRARLITPKVPPSYLHSSFGLHHDLKLAR